MHVFTVQALPTGMNLVLTNNLYRYFFLISFSCDCTGMLLFNRMLWAGAVQIVPAVKTS